MDKIGNQANDVDLGVGVSVGVNVGVKVGVEVNVGVNVGVEVIVGDGVSVSVSTKVLLIWFVDPERCVARNGENPFGSMDTSPYMIDRLELKVGVWVAEVIGDISLGVLANTGREIRKRDTKTMPIQMNIFN